jgi:DNA-binding protein HU-beta
VRREERMVKVGDVVEVAARKVGETPRTGTVTALRGALITVRWDSGAETVLIPGAGTLAVVGSKRAAGAKKTSPGARPPKARARATSKGAAAKRRTGKQVAASTKSAAAKKPAAKKATPGKKKAPVKKGATKSKAAKPRRR